VEGAAAIACELCDAELTVSDEALRDPKILEQDLPTGWTVYVRRDATTGEYVRVVRCPDHQP
jgi:hypothetical protein